MNDLVRHNSGTHMGVHPPYMRLHITPITNNGVEYSYLHINEITHTLTVHVWCTLTSFCFYSSLYATLS